jgi:hypothetical protein
MALSMDEQRMLDEIERRLADEDPVLAARLTGFGPPGLGITLRSRRRRMVASLVALITLAVIAVAAYAIVPFGPRHAAKPRPAPASSQPAVTARTAASSRATSGSGLSPSGAQSESASPSVGAPAAQVPHQP